MRKMYFLLLALVIAMGVQAQTQSNALYVYRNDGGFNAFLREDVDSISLSYFDVDSIRHTEPVCQVFHTPDSAYRIPIAAIDSVSFVQPEVKYAPGVILLTSRYLPYISDVTENAITFSGSTPAALMPKKGDVLAAMVFEGALCNGFAGRVESERADGGSVRFECSDVSIEDIYEQFVYTGKAIAADESGMAKVRGANSRASGLNTFNIGTIKASCGPVSVEAHPVIKVIYTINRNPDLKTHQALVAIADIDVNVSLDAKVEAGDKPHIAWLPADITIPTGVPGLYGFIRGGAFYKASAEASVTATCPGHIHWRFGFTNGDGGLERIWKYGSSIQRPEFSVNMEGELDAGLCTRIGFRVISDKLAGIYLTGYGGLYAKAEFSLTNAGLADGTLYSSLKDSQLEAGAYISGEPGYTVAGQQKDVNLSWEGRFPFHTWYLLPEFSEPRVNKGEAGGSAVVQGSPGRDLVMPVRLGIGVEDEDGKVVATKWCGSDYRLEGEWASNALRQQFDGLTAGKSYTAFPYVRVLGYEMKAAPSKKFEIAERLVEITDFKVTSSKYQKNGFQYNGAKYSYMFNTSVKLTLKDTEGIEDWGYVYRDPNGKDALISLKSFGTSYTDTRYAYYRNESESDCILFGYVKYQGREEYCFDEPQTFRLKHTGEACKDGNHVHMMDLGLSVKWACCNVGASSPEEYGDYFAWGETQPKSSYNGNSLTWRKSVSELQSAGIIDGNGVLTRAHDAASANWGGSWRMPTEAEIEELQDKCTWIWTQQGGKNGYKVTGPNGNSIFLPAAGTYYYSTLSYDGEGGNFWSSTVYDGTELAYDLYFLDGNHGTYWNCRYDGRSVRPVSE